ncbi:phage tail assembly protein [Thiobacter aerophilum]|uniref:Phage tail assembly protein n=1 Tax=Thiobacter aerophilum TaxID=3121275 RepID=A0ABV0EDQ0_9BURK
MEVKLKHPVKLATGQLLEKITLRRATRGDIKRAQKAASDPVDQEDFLLAALTGLTIEDLDALDIADSRVLSDAFRAMVDS